MHLGRMRVRTLYTRLIVVIAVTMLVVSALVGWKAKDSAPPIKPSDLVSLMPDKYLNLATCESRGWSAQGIHAPNGMNFFLCMPRGEPESELNEALRAGESRYLRGYALKIGVIFWAAIMAFIVLGLSAGDWIARAAGKGFLFYEADTPLISRSAKQSAIITAAAFVTMSLVLSFGMIKQAMFASFEYPLTGFLIAWMGLELGGRPVRFTAALVACWVLVLLSSFLTWPALGLIGKNWLGAAYILPAVGLISLMRTLLPYSSDVAPRMRRSKGNRAALAFLLTFGIGFLIVIPAEISDILRTLRSG